MTSQNASVVVTLCSYFLNLLMLLIKQVALITIIYIYAKIVAELFTYPGS